MGRVRWEDGEWGHRGIIRGWEGLDGMIGRGTLGDKRMGDRYMEERGGVQEG